MIRNQNNTDSIVNVLKKLFYKTINESNTIFYSVDNIELTIHTDFERGFIKSEVIKFADYEKYKTELACKEAGKLSIEGKEYIVGDGDALPFQRVKVY